MLSANSNLIFSGHKAALDISHPLSTIAFQADTGLFGFDPYTIGLAFVVIAGGIAAIFILRRRAAAKALKEENESLNLRRERNERRLRTERRASGRETERDRRLPKENRIEDDRRLEAAAKEATIDDLPIILFNGLAALPEVEPLLFSEDESLMAAIEEANEQVEADAEIRAMAIKILVMFRNANAVETVARIVINDPSPQVRARAAAALAEYDHESVFPAIVLASADNTREVRAAAAKALFGLSFDRGHCWARLAEMSDDPMSIQLAKAAIEGGLAARALDRLVHTDMRAAYEAFAMMVFLIRTGEFAPIIEAIGQRKDYRIILALLHVVSVEKNQDCIEQIRCLAKTTVFPAVIREQIMALSAENEGAGIQ